MAVLAPNPDDLKIVTYPAAVLRQRAEPVPAVDEAAQAVAARMIELMHEAKGVGLAAPQVGVSWRMFVANWTGNAGDDHVFINPELVEPSSDTGPHDEGCLSIPDVTVEVTRPLGVTIKATDVNGQAFTMTDDGTLAARVWQHEYDHLEGVLILDRMTRLDKMANRKAIRALEAAG